MDYKLDKLKRFNSDSFLVIDVSSAGSETIRSMPLSTRQNLVARRLSSSSAHLSPTTPIKTPSRLDQIKFEECLGEVNREVAHERELQNAIGISNVWEEFNLDDKEMMETNVPKLNRTTTIEPLFICTNLVPGLVRSSLSPARIPRKQCFSPSLQQPIKDLSFSSNSLTPTSPNKFLNGQSLSPIILRPSPLSFNKRKNDDNKDSSDDNFNIPLKKFKTNSGSLLSSYNSQNYRVPDKNKNDNGADFCNDLKNSVFNEKLRLTNMCDSNYSKSTLSTISSHQNESNATSLVLENYNTGELDFNSNADLVIFKNGNCDMQDINSAQ